MAGSVTQLHQFQMPVIDDRGREWTAHALGARRADGRWIGWLEFVRESHGGRPAAGSEIRVTGRETMQASISALVYWATGLEATYLDGALARSVGVSASGLPIEDDRLTA